MKPKTSKPVQRKTCATANSVEEIEEIIAGLDQLALQADHAELGTAARILYTAKEELVHWAAVMQCHETTAENYINQHLYLTRKQAPRTAKSL